MTPLEKAKRGLTIAEKSLAEHQESGNPAAVYVATLIRDSAADILERFENQEAALSNP